MNDDVLLKLIELQMNQFNKTRDTKTKINLAIWTFFVVTASFASLLNIKPSDVIFICIVSFFALLIILHYFWMKGIQKSLNFDKHTWENYRYILVPPSQTKKANKKRWFEKELFKTFLDNWKWIIIETGTTFIFAVLACLSFTLAGSRNTNSPRSDHPIIVNCPNNSCSKSVK